MAISGSVGCSTFLPWRQCNASVGPRPVTLVQVHGHIGTKASTE